jgi:RimJ/RimL family protein N-acetyltransferase
VFVENIQGKTVVLEYNGGILMFIKRNNLTIRNATLNDASILGKWWRDGRIMESVGFPNGIPIADKEIETQLLKETDETRRTLIIEHNNAPIGEMGYKNRGNQVVEIGIKICDSEKQEKGFGTQILRMFICSLFDELGYKNIILDTNLKSREHNMYMKSLAFVNWE